MLIFYQNTSSIATRTAKNFLDKQNLDYAVKRLDTSIFTWEQFKKILSGVEGGVYSLISKRSSAYLKLVNEDGIDLEDLKLSELYELLRENTNLLKTPIVVNYDDLRVVVGSDEDKLFKFHDMSTKRAQRDHYRNYSNYLDTQEEPENT